MPLHPKDIVSSKKVHALRKEQKRKLGKQRSLGSPMDYSPLPIDKHEPEFVSIQSQLFEDIGVSVWLNAFVFSQRGHAEESWMESFRE